MLQARERWLRTSGGEEDLRVDAERRLEPAPESNLVAHDDAEELADQQRQRNLMLEENGMGSREAIVGEERPGRPWGGIL